MAKPTPFLFDTNGTNSDADLSPILKTDGYVNNAVPTARQFDTALKLISQNLAYSQGVENQCHIPEIYFAGGGGWVATDGASGYSAVPGIQTAASATALIKLRGVGGQQMTAAGLTFLVKNSTGTDVLDIGLVKIPVTDAAYTYLRRRHFQSGGIALPTVAADETLGAAAATAASITLTVAGTTDTYTRSSGSFLTDGWAVGDYLEASGFVNGANNFTMATPRYVLSVSALVMTVLHPGGGGVPEGPVAVTLDNGTIPALDGTFSYGLSIQSTMTPGDSIAISALRYALARVA